MRLSRVQKGLIAEAEFVSFAHKQGFNHVCKPLDFLTPYDFVIVNPSLGTFIRVQVKCSYFNPWGYQQVNNRRIRKQKSVKYQDGDFDWIFIYDLANNKRYWIPWNVIRHYKSNYTVSAPGFAKWEVKSGRVRSRPRDDGP